MTRSCCLILLSTFLVSLSCSEHEAPIPGAQTPKALAARNQESQPSVVEERKFQLDRFAATAVGEALEIVFGTWQEKVYLDESRYFDSSLSKVGGCEVEVISRERYNSRFAKHNANQKPVLAETKVYRKDGESENEFHVVISYRGQIGISGCWDGVFRIEEQKAVLVDESYVLE